MKFGGANGHGLSEVRVSVRSSRRGLEAAEEAVWDSSGSSMSGLEAAGATSSMGAAGTASNWAGSIGQGCSGGRGSRSKRQSGPGTERTKGREPRGIAGQGWRGPGVVWGQRVASEVVEAGGGVGSRC